MVDDVAVDIGTDFDQSNSIFLIQRGTRIDGSKWMEHIQAEHDRAVKDQATSVNDIVIPTQREGQYFHIQMQLFFLLLQYFNIKMRLQNVKFFHITQQITGTNSYYKY